MYSKEFYSILEETTKEINDAKIKLISIHPEDLINNKESVLTEAVFNKDSIEKSMKKLIDNIKTMVEKFIRMSHKLSVANKHLIDKYSKVKIDSSKLKDFEYEIFPYWDGLDRIKSFNPPQFKEDMVNDLISGGMQFKQLFEKGTFNEDGSVNPNFFRGSENKLKVQSGNANMVFSKCLDIIKSREAISNDISSKSKNLSMTSQNVIRNVPITESVILNESIFKEDYLDILFEDAVTTTSDIKKEENRQEAEGIDVNSTENSSAKKASDINSAVQKYITIVYGVISTMMSILDEAYDQSIKLCERLSNKS